eukprot:3206722-Prymnesium_polylepis.1
MLSAPARALVASRASRSARRSRGLSTSVACRTRPVATTCDEQHSPGRAWESGEQEQRGRICRWAVGLRARG